MRALSIVAMCTGSAVAYGILHDMVTARVCVEYFTIGHPPIFGTNSPTLLALGWGVIATWWAGLILGVPLAIAALAGKRPKRGVGSLVRPVAQLLAVMGASALLAGLTGYALARARLIELVEPIASLLPADRHTPFLADVWAHSASYFVGFLGGIFVIVKVWKSRSAPAPRDTEAAGSRGA